MYYHGGIPGLNVGDRILPPRKTGKDTLLKYARVVDPNGPQRDDRVYVTTSKAMACSFAFVYPNGDVYAVRPVAPLERDPDCLENGLSYQCPEAVVLAVVERHPSGNGEQAAPCPFCGWPNILVKTSYEIMPGGLTMMLCPNCGLTASFQGREERSAAIAAWNRRCGAEGRI
jgi:Lar family restriction alleviation protein